MKQISCHVNDEVAERVRKKARDNEQSISSYLRSLVKKDIPDQWPEGYFEVFGKWEGTLERPDQGDFEIRESFD